MSRVMHIVGARPNFMKAAPVMAALTASDMSQMLVHTGQHYDANMSAVFFEQLGLPLPDVNLEAGSSSHAAQTGEIMLRFEPVLLRHRPDLLVVYGDVNSTIACALVAAKLNIPVAHVEAGLRSWDRSMPEEINRILTDHIAELLFTPSPDADENLKREGIGAEKIHFVGNVMIDTLVQLLPRAEARWESLCDELSLSDFADAGQYGLVTLHRPTNVDDPAKLAELVEVLNHIAQDIPLIFPVHPRTRHHLESLEELSIDPRLRFIDPAGYADFLTLQRYSRLVITDSGGIQEETTYLGIPCFTLRQNTERPITVTQGTNVMVGESYEALQRGIQDVLAGKAKRGSIPTLWDGHSGERIASVVRHYLDASKAKTAVNSVA